MEYSQDIPLRNPMELILIKNITFYIYTRIQININYSYILFFLVTFERWQCFCTKLNIFWHSILSNNKSLIKYKPYQLCKSTNAYFPIYSVTNNDRANKSFCNLHLEFLPTPNLVFLQSFHHKKRTYLKRLFPKTRH